DEPREVLGDTLGARRRDGVPIMPAVVTRKNDYVAARGRARNADSRRVGLRPGLEEANHFRARDDAREPLRDLDLERMREREDAPARELTRDRFGDGGEGVPEGDRGEPEDVVDVLVAVDVPDSAAVSPIEEHGIGTLDEHARALTQGLGCARH